MTCTFSKYFVRSTLKLLSIFALMFSMIVGAQASEAWLSGPSVIALGTTVTYSAGNLTPNTLVRVQTKEEGSPAYDDYVMVSEDGTLSHTVDPSLDGQLGLSVLDSSNNELATTNVIVTQ